MIESLIDALQRLGLRGDADDLADVIWLAAHLPEPPADAAGPPRSRRTMSARTEVDTSAPGRPERATEGVKLETRLDLHALAPAGHVPTHAGGSPLRSPATPAIPNALRISRALRPIVRTAPERLQLVFDEEATAQRIAESEIWVPVLRPAPVRWLDAALVVDESASMAVWAEITADLRLILERQGAFRDVRTWRLRTDGPDQTVQLLSGAGDSKRAHRTGELIDPGGRRLILVVTDCVSEAWWNGTIWRLLRRWGQTCPLALVQMLPPRLWSGTALGSARPLYLYAPSPGVPNSRLKALPGTSGDVTSNPLDCPVPVVTLEPEALGAWASVLAGAGDAVVPGFVWTGQCPTPDAPHQDREEALQGSLAVGMSPRERIDQFRGTASPEAQRLAVYLAAAPLSLPVMRLVHRTTFSEPRQVHLAEVFLSGLLREADTSNVTAQHHAVWYDFVDGVRDLLLDELQVPNAVRVLTRVSEFVEGRLGQNLDFPAILADPSAAGDLMIDEQSRPFARVAASVLRRLGGRYADVAESVDEALGELAGERRRRDGLQGAHDEDVPRPEDRARQGQAVEAERLEHVDVPDLSHAEVRARLSEHLDGTLSDVERWQVDRHLTACTSCTHYYSTLRFTVNVIQQLPQPSAPVSARARLVDAARSLAGDGGSRPVPNPEPRARSRGDRFDKFTERARKVLQLAQEEAQRFNHNYIGTEHLLLGLVREDEGVAAKVLANLGVEPNRVRSAVEFIIGRSDRDVTGDVGLTPRGKKAIELSVDEALRLNHHYIGTEHLLLGLVREGEGIAAGVLESLGVSLDKVRSQVIYVLNQSQSYSQQVSRHASNTPLTDVHSTDLTAAARANELDLVIGRAREIERVIQILSRRTKNNPLLIGQPGVGKTAIVEGLAQRIANGNVPETLMGKRLLTLDVNAFVASTEARGNIEGRLKTMINELTNTGRCILIINEMHTLVGAGVAEGAVEAANILKLSLARGEIQAIGATTPDEYRKYIEPDSVLDRRFQPVLVEEPSLEETIEILKGIADRFEDHHHLQISEEALKSAAELAARYAPDRFLPDKAIDLVDEAASRVQMQRASAPPSYKEMLRSLESVQNEKEAAISAQQYELASEYVGQEAKLRAKLEKIESGWQTQQSADKPVVTAEDIEYVVAMRTGQDLQHTSDAENSRLQKTEDAFDGSGEGFDDAFTILTKAVRRARAGLGDPRRPVGSYFFVGGQSSNYMDAANLLVNQFFGGADSLLRLSMADYATSESASRLFAQARHPDSPNSGGVLYEWIRRMPHSVIVFEQIELAHGFVQDLIESIFRHGAITNTYGTRADFSHAVILITSNVELNLGPQGFSVTEWVGHSNENLVQHHNKASIVAKLRPYVRSSVLDLVDGISIIESTTTPSSATPSPGPSDRSRRVAWRPEHIFVMYSRRDRKMYQCLERELGSLRRDGFVEQWQGHEVGAAREWEGLVDPALDACTMVLVLVSRSFVNSGYWMDVEMERALERESKGEIHIIPILLRPYNWQRLSFARQSALPHEKAVADWINQDGAWKEVTRGLREIISRDMTA